MLVRENGVAVRMWREASNSLRDLADRTGDMVLICDLDGTISYASPLVSGFSYPPEALVGKELSEFVHPEDIGAARAAVAAVIGLPEDEALTPAAADSVLGPRDRVADGEDGVDRSGRFSCRVRAADGSWRHVECAVLLYRLPGEPARLLVSLRDVSDQVALRQQVTHLTFHDGLTGLPNRAYVEERAREALEPTPDRQAGVIFLDLDGFTEVNDLVGHGAGDLVLAQAARRLREVVPAQETVARWGGDEFAVLLENAAGAQEIVELAERLAGIVAGAPFKVAEREIGLTASVGVALADESAPGVVLRNADVAMAKAKDSGGARVEVYAPQMHADVVRRLDMASDLQRAITREELTLQYQPIVELATSRVVGAEALVRWWRGDEAVSPRAFLTVAEDSGLINQLGEWVLRKACAQGAAWRDASWDVGISVNIGAAPAQRAAVLRPGGGGAGGDRPAPERADHRGQRADAGRGRRADRRPAGGAARPRRQARHRRLRHRLRVARPPAPAAGRHHQDRPVLRLRPRRRPGADAADQDHRPGRPRPRHAGDRRGHRAAAASWPS